MRVPLISLQGRFTERLAVDLHVALRGLSLMPANEVAFMFTALSMVSAEPRVTPCIPYAASLVRLHQLEMRALADPVVSHCSFVFSHKAHSLSPAAQNFMDFLVRHVAGHQNIAPWTAVDFLK